MLRNHASLHHHQLPDTCMHSVSWHHTSAVVHAAAPLKQEAWCGTAAVLQREQGQALHSCMHSKSWQHELGCCACRSPSTRRCCPSTAHMHAQQVMAHSKVLQHVQESVNACTAGAGHVSLTYAVLHAGVPETEGVVQAPHSCSAEKGAGPSR